MDILRTPEARFDNLAGYDFTPNYVEIKAADGAPVRMHYLDEGPRDGQLILCLHGQPSWSYLYRKMIPLLTAAGHRVIAPDLIGFGKSDKPAARNDYSYGGHVDWLRQFVEALDLQAITLMCQDWGGLLGLRFAGQQPERFARLVIANTGLPSSDSVGALAEMLGSLMENVPVPRAVDVQKQFQSGAADAFLYWVKFADASDEFTARRVFEVLSGITDDAVLRGYEAPFPDESYMSGARQFPSLVPLLPHHEPDRKANDAAWQVLEKFTRPVLTAFSDDDPVTKGGEVAFQERVPGAKNVQHITIKNGGHFLQEMQPEALSKAIIDFMAAHPL